MKLSISSLVKYLIESMPQCVLGAICWPSSGNERSPQERSFASLFEAYPFGNTDRPSEWPDNRSLPDT
jgi:hypothetical protein